MTPVAIPGVGTFGYADLVSAAAALAIVVAAALAAIVAARRGGDALARAWERTAGVHTEGVAARMCDLVRYGSFALIVAIARAVEPWPLASAVILGVPLALAVALFAATLMLGLHMPRIAAAGVAAAAFVALVADTLGGLDAMLAMLDRIGFSAGSYRFSLLRLAQIAIGLTILYALTRLASRVINHSIKRAGGLDATQQLLAQKLSGVALLVIAFFIGIDLIGIDLTALAVFSGAFGLAIGFGLQKTFGNLIAGIILLMDRSIKPGDVIVVGDSFGHVNKIGVRAVSVVTRDGKEHLIPNENLMTQEVENWSYSSPNVRIHIRVGVGYGCDLAVAQQLMIEAAMTPKRVLANPKPTVWLRAFGDSSVDHDILVWIADPEAGVGNVQSEILNRLWLLFKEHGIELPFPQRDVRVKEWPAPSASG